MRIMTHLFKKTEISQFLTSNIFFLILRGFEPEKIPKRDSRFVREDLRQVVDKPYRSVQNNL